MLAAASFHRPAALALLVVFAGACGAERPPLARPVPGASSAAAVGGGLSGAPAGGGSAPSAAVTSAPGVATSTMTCPSGQQRTGSGCCWPGQQWLADRCDGYPRCPEGFVLTGRECVAAAEHVSGLIARCGTVGIGFGAPPADDERRRACEELAGRLDVAQPLLAQRCEAGAASACSLLGASLVGSKATTIYIDLGSPRCHAGPGSACHARHRRVERMAFPGPRAELVAARGAFEAACRGRDAAGCVELALLVAAEDGAGAALSHERTACLSVGHPAACAEAAYLHMARGRITDAALFAEATRVLTAECDRPDPGAGAGPACNALGFMVERGVVAGRPSEDAPAYYGRACEAGAAAGCANLVVYGLNHRAQARTLVYGRAAAVLAAACVPADEQARASCLAYGLVLSRGLGTKVRPREGRALLGKLCGSGYRDACGL